MVICSWAHAYVPLADIIKVCAFMDDHGMLIITAMVHCLPGHHCPAYACQGSKGSKTAQHNHSNVPRIGPSLGNKAFSFLLGLYKQQTLHRDALDDHALDYLSKIPPAHQVCLLISLFILMLCAH